MQCHIPASSEIEQEKAQMIVNNVIMNEEIKWGAKTIDFAEDKEWVHITKEGHQVPIYHGDNLCCVIVDIRGNGANGTSIFNQLDELSEKYAIVLVNNEITTLCNKNNTSAGQFVSEELRSLTSIVQLSKRNNYVKEIENWIEKAGCDSIGQCSHIILYPLAMTLSDYKHQENKITAFGWNMGGIIVPKQKDLSTQHKSKRRKIKHPGSTYCFT